MKDTTKAVIEYRLKRARESLSDAQHLLQSNSLLSSVNRIYYAMFYSVTALLLTANLSSPKHSGVKALFNKEFVNKGLVDKESGRFYSEIFERRQKGDYKDFTEFAKEDVEAWLKKAQEFLNEIESLSLKLTKEGK